MAALNQPEVPQYDECGDDRNAPVDRFAVEQAHLRMVLDEVAADVAAAMKDAGFSVEVFFTSPADGEALLNFATDIDPLHSDWPQVREIICSIVSSRVGIEGLWCRNVPCASPTDVVAIPQEMKEPML
jgi:hypothetical protein